VKISELLTEAPLEDVNHVQLRAPRYAKSKIGKMTDESVLKVAKRVLGKVKTPIYYNLVRGVTYNEIWKDAKQHNPERIRDATNDFFYLKVDFEYLAVAIAHLINSSSERVKALLPYHSNAINVYVFEDHGPKRGYEDITHYSGWGFVHDFLHTITLSTSQMAKELEKYEQEIDDWASSRWGDEPSEDSTPMDWFIKNFVITKSKQHLIDVQQEELTTELFTQYMFKDKVEFAKAKNEVLQRGLDKLAESGARIFEKILAEARGVYVTKFDQGI